MNRITPSTTMHATATVLGALVVIGGAWSISISIGRTRATAIQPQLRVLNQQRAFGGGVEELPTTIVPSAASGVVSVVLTLPGGPIASWETLMELDREPLIAEFLRSLPAGSTVGLGERVPPEALRAKNESLKAKEQQELNALRTTLQEYRQKLEQVANEMKSVSATLELPVSNPLSDAEEIQDIPEELRDALNLAKSALEGSILSQTLTLSDIRIFFGAAQGADSLFLQSLPQPQQAVPYWEKLLESERLKELIQSRLKSSAEFSNAQDALQLLLTSRALTQMASDILEGLGKLLATIEPSDQFTASDVEQQTRLLVRNTASMATLLETLKIHEERLVVLAEKIAAARQLNIEQQEQARQRFAQLARDRAGLLGQASEQIRARYRAVQAVRKDRSRALEEMAGGVGASTQGQLALRVLQERLDTSSMRAPTSGVVASVVRAVGDSVALGQSVAVIAAAQPVVRVAVPERLALSLGQFADVVVGAPSAPRHFAGQIQTVNAPNEQETAFTVQIRSPEEFIELTSAGDRVTVGLTLATLKPVRSIPSSSIVSTPQGAVVYVVDQRKGTRNPRPVVVGFVGDDGWVEIIQGITERDLVLAEPSS